LRRGRSIAEGVGVVAIDLGHPSRPILGPHATDRPA